MRVLFVNKFFYLNGGSERVFFQERDYLIRNGCSVIDFSMQDERNFPSSFSEFFVPNISYHNTKGFNSKLQQAISFIHSSVAVVNLEKLLKKERPQIAHLHNIYHQLTPSIISVLKRNGLKVVLTMHDSKLVCPSYLALNRKKICTACNGRAFWKPFTTNCQSDRGKGLLLSLEAFFHKWRKSYEAVDCFIAPSQFLADLTSCRIPREKIRVLRNSIDSVEFQPQYNGKDYALYFGRLSKEKGIETLLKAVDRLPEKLPLRIVGSGPLSDELQQSYTKATFVGYRSGQELNDLIANAAFVIVPSEWYENCSMVVLEAMAFGKPVIGSRVGGIPEQIDDGITGFLFEMGNVAELGEKILKLWSNKNLRNRMGKAARKKLEKEYSLESHCNNLLGIYKQLLAE